MEKEYFVIKEEKEYIGLDETSGGYPYKCSLFQGAKFWSRKGAAFTYMDIFKEKNWTLHQMSVTTTEVERDESDNREERLVDLLHDSLKQLMVRIEAELNKL